MSFKDGGLLGMKTSKKLFSRSAAYRVWEYQKRKGTFGGTVSEFLAKYGVRPSGHFLFSLEEGWILKKRYTLKPEFKTNQRNYKHGQYNSPTYRTWSHLKYHLKLFNGTFLEFVEKYGYRPGSGFRFQTHTGTWYHKQERPLTPLWQYLTPEQIKEIYRDIEYLCKRGRYDFDDAINELYRLNISKAEKPMFYVQSWVRRYLPKVMAKRPKYVPLSALAPSAPEWQAG